MKSSAETLIAAMRILAQDIQSEDGVANAAIAEAADRLEELKEEVERLREHNDELQQHNVGLAESELKLQQERDQLKADNQSIRVKHDILNARVDAINFRDCERDAEVIGRAAKPIATEFFRWWYNQPGSNTDQGFDEWWKLRQQVKKVQS